MTTLQELFNSENDTEYAVAREKTVSDIASYLCNFLKHADEAEDWAEEVMSTAEEMGWIDGNEVSGEIPGRHTASGHPLSFTV